MVIFPSSEPAFGMHLSLYQFSSFKPESCWVEFYHIFLWLLEGIKRNRTWIAWCSCSHLLLLFTDVARAFCNLFFFSFFLFCAFSVRNSQHIHKPAKFLFSPLGWRLSIRTSWKTIRNVVKQTNVAMDSTVILIPYL